MSIATALTPQGSPAMSSTGTNTSPVSREGFTAANTDTPTSAPSATTQGAPAHNITSASSTSEHSSSASAHTQAQSDDSAPHSNTDDDSNDVKIDSANFGEEEKGKFVCPLCDNTFTRHHNLKSHLLTHSHEKPFTCETCNSKFRRLHDLKRHVKLHTGEKPYNCEKCGRKFARGDALVRHMKGSGTCTGINVDERDFQGYQPLQPKAVATPNQQPIQAVQPSPVAQVQGPLLAPAPTQASASVQNPISTHPAPTPLPVSASQSSLSSDSSPPTKKRSMSPFQHKSPPSFGAPGGGGVPAPSTRHVSHLPPPQMYVPSHHTSQPPPPHGRATMLPYPATGGAPGSTEEHLLALVKTLESRIWSLEERIHVTESRIAFLESSQRPH